MSCHMTKGNLACRRVAICETVVIPPHSEVIVAAQFVEGEASDGAGAWRRPLGFKNIRTSWWQGPLCTPTSTRSL